MKSWTDRVGRRVKLRDLHIPDGGHTMGQHGQSSKAPRHFHTGRVEDDCRLSNTRSACLSSTVTRTASSRRSTAARSSNEASWSSMN
jgi:hypothetical protein